MTYSFLSLLTLAAAGVSAVSVGRFPRTTSEGRELATRDTSGLSPGCQNSPNSRKCWGKYDINTNYYDEVFHTGKTVEYWLNIEEIDCHPDGYKRKCQVANGTMPGPAITADWGDDVVVHVTNNLPINGTAIHWHGIRQLNTNEYDGTPGVSQCPIPPGDSMTYKFHASQYGTSMWHSHFAIQYSMGLHGPLNINGPATADYDEDLDTIFMTDWGHETEFATWASVATFNVTFDGALTGIINGQNTGNCTATNATKPDPNCIDGGHKYELNFEPGKKYRLRLINIATEAWFQFSIDGHKMTVIAMDLVPIVPYETNNVLVNMGQRYDVIVEANAPPGDYWLRSGFVKSCIPNGAPENITGIVRYNKDSTVEPTSTSDVKRIGYCMDEPTASLVPWVPVDVKNIDGNIISENVTGEYFQGKFLRWSFNKADGGFMWTNWSQPALGDVVSGNIAGIPKGDNAFPIGALTNATAAKFKDGKQWGVLVLEDITRIPGITHPMHLHGHDFVVLSSGLGLWDESTVGWQLKNPERRDTITMPPNGFIVMAWALDNPGIWALHCHIPWHSSQGFSATVLESPALIPGSGATKDWDTVFAPQCKKWNDYYPTSTYKQDDSGV
ncbi:uncharacterized protein KY384_007865 [Bacidia gigantensis]|uniref:uncharacterized protein n=1 Tax=Bacidia gigantensis TaxID=2732470 RepID=UPI001D0491E4|nr:uncharacterized protein KY384_007865 [Bacidia gigantensis]KAG8527711.1 hypothetical protein KY384_007865 [Bacidia gigantensis]